MNDLIVHQIAEYLKPRLEAQFRRLRLSLAAETGGGLIKQDEELRRTRRNTYWVGAAMLVLMLARPEDGKAKITLFASLELPIIPLLSGLLLYLVLCFFQFRQELWRENLRYNKASEGQNRIGELERATEYLLEQISTLERRTNKWGESLSKPNEFLRSEVNATRSAVLEASEFAASLDRDLRDGSLGVNPAFDRAAFKLKTFHDMIDDERPDLRMKSLDEAQAAAAQLTKELGATRKVLKVETDSFFALSSDLKFRERIVFIMVDSLLPSTFAVLTMIAAVNYLAASFVEQPVYVFDPPHCPICPVQESSSSI